MPRTVSLAALAAIALSLASHPAAPQSFAPTRPVKVVSPFPSGLGPDVVARVLADRLTKVWNQQVIVEPRPGAHGILAIGAIKKGKPDGHELGFISMGHLAINPNLLKSIPYDPERDFALLSMVYRTPFYLVVSTAGAHRSIPELIAHAKANPDKLTYSSPSVGSVPHLGGALLAFMTDTRMVHVPYKEGQQPYLAVANGDVDWTLGSMGSVMPLVNAGKIRILAVTTRSRLPNRADIPTVEEAGGPAGFFVDSWGSMVAPASVPADVARSLALDIAAALAHPEVVEGLRRIGFEASPSTPAQLAEVLQSDLKKYGELIKRVGVQPE